MSGNLIDPKDAEALTLKVGLGTILGLLTGGLYWAFVFSRWSQRHADLRTATLSRQKAAPEATHAVERKSRRTRLLALLLKVLGSIALITLVWAFIWEVVQRRGPFPIPEEPFWVFCWVALSTLALTWGSLASEVRSSMEYLATQGIAPHRPWLLGGGRGRIPAMVILNVILALGLLPLVIFPPLAASAVNNYVHSCLTPGAA
ncbi:MAG: hypothetical protein H7A12_03725 [Pseudomonadales bacterium]|jgi:hypothetical protein|nr:hypothetical protein [Pseudomonadales bacterium]